MNIRAAILNKLQTPPKMFQMFLEQHSYRCKENIKSRCTLNLRHFGDDCNQGNERS